MEGLRVYFSDIFIILVSDYFFRNFWFILIYFIYIWEKKLVYNHVQFGFSLFFFNLQLKKTIIYIMYKEIDLLLVVDEFYYARFVKQFEI